jgi:NAD(P)-dependent dehydrogenase (short-subunit alcohol dehydrogenase family)
MRGDYRSSFDLTGRVAVVTGATGLLGRHFCAALADHGAKLALIDLDPTKCDELAVELSGQFNVECMGVGVDIRDSKLLQEAADEIEARLGPVHVLHNNAQANRSDPIAYFTSVENYEMRTWSDIMSVNLDAAFLVAKTFGSRMAERKSGSIIQTASIYGVVAPDQRIYEGALYLGHQISTPAVYSASKAGLIGLTKYLATYWGGDGVRVNTLTPGGVSSGQNETFDRKYSARVPLGRMAKADDLCGALVFLASDASSYVTGQNIIIDGGLSAW